MSHKEGLVADEDVSNQSSSIVDDSVVVVGAAVVERPRQQSNSDLRIQPSKLPQENSRC